MNYEQFFGLTDKPFRQSPDTDYFFSSDGHKELMHHLLYCIGSDDGFVEITGEPGIGKTITVRSLLKQIVGDKVRVSLIVNPKITPQDLLFSFALDCGMDETIIEQSPGEKLLRLLHKHLKELDTNNIVPLIIIDEAQNLSDDALEQLCLISNLETDKKKLVKIVLLGQPQLRNRLQDPALKKIDNRITIRYHLRPLSKTDMANYINHRLRIASAPGTPFSSIFTEKVLSLIYKHSQGIPRFVNIICERTLMAAFTENARGLSNSHVKKAIRSFQDEQDVNRISMKRILWTSASFLCLGVLLYIIIHLFHSPDTKITMHKHIQTKVIKPETIPQPLAVTSDTKDLIEPQPKIETESRTAIQPGSELQETIEKTWGHVPHDAPEKLKTWPAQSLFTKNSYFIVISPDINRMVVWQGKPDFNDLTQVNAPVLQLKEGVYFMDKNQSISQIYTSTTESPLTTNNTILSENVSSPTTVLSNTQTTKIDATKLETAKSELIQITPNNQFPDNMTESDVTANTPSVQVIKKQSKLPVKQNINPPKKPTPASEKKQQRIEIPENNEAPHSVTHPREIVALPEKQMMAIISLETKQMAIWKGTETGPRLVAQQMISFEGSEGIYILCQHKNKPCLFNPKNAIPHNDKCAERLWQAIKPKTSALPVIVSDLGNKSANKSLTHVPRLKSLVRRWESAWHQKDLDVYMNLYVNDKISFFKLNAQPIQLNWKILKNSQAKVFSAKRSKILHIDSPVYVLDPGDANQAIAMFNQSYADANYAEKGLKVLYLKYTQLVDTNQKDWQIYGRLWIH